MGIYKNALMLPIINARGGLYTNGHLIKQSLLFRSWGQIHFPVAYIGQKKYSNEEVLYGCQLFSHFGHFILESLARVWYLCEHKDIPIAWSARGEKLCNYQKEILNFLGISISPILVEEPTVFRKVHLPEPGYIIQNIFQAQHMKALGVIEPSKITKGKKVYVSRSKLTGCGGANNEEEIETKLIQKGWEIFHPQDYSVSHQLSEISSAEYICGISGSAFHSLIFLKHLDSKLILLTRPEGFNNNYNTIAIAKKFDQHVIDHNLLYSYSSGKGYKTRATLNIDKTLELIYKQTTQKKFFTTNSDHLNFTTQKKWISNITSTPSWHTEDVANIQYLNSLYKKADRHNDKADAIISAIAIRLNELYFNLIVLEKNKKIDTLRKLLLILSEVNFKTTETNQPDNLLTQAYNKLHSVNININEELACAFRQSKQDQLLLNFCQQFFMPNKSELSICNIETMIDSLPHSDAWRFRYSVALLVDDRIEAAFKQIKIAIELNSQRHEYYFVISYIYRKNNQIDNFLKSFRHTLSLLLKNTTIQDQSIQGNPPNKGCS